MTKSGRLPEGMGRRLWTMLWFTIALGFTGFGNITELAYMPAMAWLGVAVAMGMYALWRDRTRPRSSGFWILMAILFSAAMIMPIRPFTGAVAALPVALLWLHDSPATPSAMVTWGMFAVLFQDLEVWNIADADTAFYVVLAMILILGAAQAERERLAVRRYAPTSRMWMFARLGAILVWSLTIVAGREAIQAISLFTYLGFDLTGQEGKITILFLLLGSLAAAALLFRRRPHKYVDPYEQPRNEKGGRVAKQTSIDFDEPERVQAATSPKANRAPAKAAPVRTTKPSKPKPSKATPRGALKPGEIDFD